MKKRDFIPYNRSLLGYARENRKTPTKTEWIFRNLILRNKQFMNYKFRRQKIIWSFILDFYCPKLLLGIEIDGGYLNETREYDEAREIAIAHYWIFIVRFTNEDIEKNLEWIVLALEEIIQDREKIVWLTTSPELD